MATALKKNDRRIRNWRRTSAHRPTKPLWSCEISKVAQYRRWLILCSFCKSAGRWFGRNEYLAKTVRERFPNEVDEFLVFGDKFQIPVSNEPIRLLANHLQGLIEAKASRLRILSKALQGDLPNRGQMTINTGAFRH